MTTLTIDGISAAYKGRVVLRNISLCIRAGEVLGLIGPNGAGKSSLLRVIGGTLRPTQGSMRLDGEDLLRMSAVERACHIAVVPQSLHVPEAFTAAEVVLMGRTAHLPRFGRERARDLQVACEAMQRTATWPLAERRMGELSGGEQQRVLIARALAQEPGVLLLDEATAHLDLKHQAAILHFVRGLARTGLIVIAAMHDLNLAAQFADRLALVRHGQVLVCDEPTQVLTHHWLQQAYDVAVMVASHPLYQTPMVALVAEEDKDG
jgi:iron complex transport system ATP-binding protein